ncbi:uncharacterized protein LOC118667020 isoform X3 [Myotis myotis]|uniref:uncharacterized protein LOC118667020 isoform X3 n=1 Tax=Myotis myotis TaxID=51298 RepID=UPI00174C0983|nr:uncharacterized protein LOC118667020 isoform X3 [Myotis myotis]
MDQGREDGLRRRCSVREPPVRGGEESIPAGTRLLAPPPHALCRLISLSIMLSSSIHAVANGFESILEGLYGPRLRRHLSLFEDCEPEELTDWSMDEKCSLCNLQREAVSSTPTEELSSQGQFNTEKIECQAENYLNALFQKKGPKEELLGLLPLRGQTCGEDIANAVIECIEKHHIPLDKIVSISTDGSKSMTGVRNGFVAILKEKINHEILTYHCIIHQEALCVQTFPEEICKVMELVIKIINSIIAKALNHHQFKEFLVEMESEYADLLLHNKRPATQIPAPLGSLGIACGDRAENHSPTPPAAPAHPSPAVPAMATVR